MASIKPNKDNTDAVNAAINKLLKPSQAPKDVKQRRAAAADMSVQAAQWIVDNYPQVTYLCFIGNKQAFGDTRHMPEHVIVERFTFEGMVYAGLAVDFEQRGESVGRADQRRRLHYQGYMLADVFDMIDFKSLITKCYGK